MSAVMPNPALGQSAAPAVAPVPPSTLSVVAPETAAERLTKSRELIRESIAAAAVPQRHALAVTETGGAASALQTLLDKAMSLPAVNVVVDAAQSWWRYHPWRAVGAVAADAGRVAVAPVANRHPIVLVLGAALLGAVLLRWGPWRWVAKRTLVAGFVPRLATRVAASVPMESWLSALAMLRRKPDPRRNPPPSV